MSVDQQVVGERQAILDIHLRAVQVDLVAERVSPFAAGAARLGAADEHVVGVVGTVLHPLPDPDLSWREMLVEYGARFLSFLPKAADTAEWSHLCSCTVATFLTGLAREQGLLCYEYSYITGHRI